MEALLVELAVILGGKLVDRFLGTDRAAAASKLVDGDPMMTEQLTLLMQALTPAERAAADANLRAIQAAKAASLLPPV